MQTPTSLTLTLGILATLPGLPGLAHAVEPLDETQHLVSGLLSGTRNGHFLCDVINKSGGLLDGIVISLKTPDAATIAGPIECDDVAHAEACTLAYDIAFPDLRLAAYCHAEAPKGFVRGSLRLEDQFEKTIAQSDLVSGGVQKVRDVDHPARQPMQFSVSDFVEVAETDMQVPISALFPDPIPGGKRFVMQHFSLRVSGDAIEGDPRCGSVANTGGSSFGHRVATEYETQGSSEFFTASLPMTLYADPGSFVGGSCVLRASADVSLRVEITGYLVDIH